MILKPGTPVSKRTSYRSTFLMNTIDKVFRRVIYNFIIASPGYLSDRQFSLRKARSAINANKVVIQLPRKPHY